MRDARCRVTENAEVSSSFLILRFEAPELGAFAPGQFVQLQARPDDGTAPFLRRPFTVMEQRGGELAIIYKRIGPGTRALAALRPGDELRALGPLGAGFDLDLSPGERALTVAGGTGLGGVVAYLQALAARGAPQRFLYGVRRRDEVAREVIAGLEALGVSVRVVSEEVEGYVTAALADEALESFGRAAICGPTPMMKAVAAALRPTIPRIELSLEEMMGCGYGICYTCPVKRAEGPGYASACEHGPVFLDREIVLS